MNLYAKPRVPRKGQDLSDALKFVLRKQYELSLCNPDIFSNADLGYLRGLSDAGVEGVSDLIDLINQHGEVEVWQE